jgi:hypothetical protein
MRLGREHTGWLAILVLHAATADAPRKAANVHDKQLESRLGSQKCIYAEKTDRALFYNDSQSRWDELRKFRLSLRCLLSIRIMIILIKLRNQLTDLPPR